MKLFLISKIPSYLKINGFFIGKVDENLKTINFEDEIELIEFIPEDCSFETFYSNLYGESCYDFCNGKLIIPSFNKKRNLNYLILSQNRYDVNNQSYLLTILKDGNVKFYLDGPFSATEELPFTPQEHNLFTFNNFIVLSFTNYKTALFIYEITDNSVNLAYKDLVNSFKVENNLIVKKSTLPLFDGNLKETWEMLRPFKLINQEYECLQNLNNELLPLHFFNLIKLGYVNADLLDANLKSKSLSLLDFIGKITYLFPHPYDISKTVIISNNQLKIYSLKFNGNLISNIIEE